MKNLLLIFLCAALLFGCAAGGGEGKTEGDVPTVSDGVLCDVKAIWLSQYDMFEVYTDGSRQRDREDYIERMERVLDNIVECGFNTVFLQVRPFGDSLCSSLLYPTSYIVTGAYGREASYDPISLLLDTARARGLSVHAWINPLRLMRDDEIGAIDDKYCIKRWYNDVEKNGKYIVRVSERWYLNPAYVEVRELIVAGACEVLDAYGFDGVHMDDYFYPTYDIAFDRDAYAEYVSKGGELSLGDFRRDAINTLVAALCRAAHERGRIFGIAPSGVADSAYAYQFADVYLWCAEDGYVDYICPQIYFGFLHGTCPFDVLCERWSRYVDGSDVALIIGITLGKAYDGYDAGAGEGRYEWRESKDVLARCLEYTLTLRGCVGACFFSYLYFYDPAENVPIQETAREREVLLPILKKALWKDCYEGKQR